MNGKELFTVFFHFLSRRSVIKVKKWPFSKKFYILISNIEKWTF